MEKETNEANSSKEERAITSVVRYEVQINATKLIAADVNARTPSTTVSDVGSQQGATCMLCCCQGLKLGSVESEDNSTVVNLLTNAENTEKISKLKIQQWV